MKFSIPSKTLYSLTSAVSKVINAKNALTILNNFLFTLDGTTLEITGSDVENALTARVEPQEVEGSGSFCIDARRLVDLLKQLPEEMLTVSIDEASMEVTIEYSSGRYSMMALAGDQFPSYKVEQDDEQPQVFSCKAEVMLNGIDKTIFAIGTDDYHPQMMGILLDIKPDDITFVATDTRKLVKFVNRSFAPGVTARCILPLKPATVLRNVFTKDDVITVTLTTKSATIQGDMYTFNCRFIKGNYPDYNRVIPQNNPYILHVDRMRFLNAVRRIGVFVDPGYGMEKFKITSDKVLLKSSDPNMLNSGIESLDCDYQGTDLVIGFSAPYLIEICNVLTTDEIVISLSDPSRAGVFRPTEDEEGTELLMLLMPMNVQDF